MVQQINTFLQSCRAVNSLNFVVEKENKFGQHPGGSSNDG